MKRPSAAFPVATLTKKPAAHAVQHIDFRKFQSAISEEFFSTTTSFDAKLIYSEMPMTAVQHKPWAGLVRDDASLRALLVFMKYKVVHVYSECPCCGRDAQLWQQWRKDNDSYRYKWTCGSYHGAECWQCSVTDGSILESLRSAQWSSFLHFALLMKGSYRVAKIYEELSDRSGADQKTVDRWKEKYWACLEKYVEEVDQMKIGGKTKGRQEMVAVDESALGKDYTKVNKPKHVKNKGRKLGPGRTRVNPLLKKTLPGRTTWNKQARRKRPTPKAIAKRPTPKSITKRPARARVNPLLKKTLPGRTTWKKPSGVKRREPIAILKRPGAKVVRRPSQDRRSKSRWIWAGVELGPEGGNKKSHCDGTKRIAMTMLPKKKDAPKGRPRGKDSLLHVMRKHLRADSGVVADEWTATPPAVAAAGSEMKGTVNHSKEWRSSSTGHHSNDVESEFGRFKLHLRVKYDYVRQSNSTDWAKKDKSMEWKLAEYVFMTNVGKSMECIMDAFRYSLRSP